MQETHKQILNLSHLNSVTSNFNELQSHNTSGHTLTLNHRINNFGDMALDAIDKMNLPCHPQFSNQIGYPSAHTSRVGRCNIVHTSVNDFHGSCIHTKQVDSLTHELQEFRKELRQLQKENALMHQQVELANLRVQEHEEKQNQLKAQHQAVMKAMEDKQHQLR